ncbi:hypothetical protein SAMN05444365_102105 [Micromonospora pattaloongensis]|uniref:Lipoprotein n=1 Tax=Micromonospora pattaloongensis TaxID=405436 RepID=A0A1H3JG32_9ACTN|nr:hypothetical protein [Micromonospora pattaloongensis]SDY38943.1 hypothetical protein SAMN05444365_102105 [Micromonospora pattaloongensis]
MRTQRLIAAAAASLVVGGLAAGCARELEPGLALRNAAGSLADAQRAAFTVKLTGNADDLVAALALAGEKSADAEPPSASDVESLRKVFNSTLTVGYDKAGTGPEDDRAFLSATINGVSGAELRVVDGVAYAKAPVPELTTMFGVPDAELAELRSTAGMVAPGMAALFDGGWVSQNVEELTKLGGAGPVGADAAAVDPAKLTAEFTTSAENLLNSAELTRHAEDRDRIVATVRTKNAYDEAVRLAKAVQPELAGEIDSSEAPADRPIRIDLWVQDDKLTAVELDVIQLVEGAKGRVAVRVEIATGREIVAPEGATPLDLPDMDELSELAGAGEIPAAGGPEAARGLAYALDVTATGIAAEENVRPTSRHLKQAAQEMVMEDVTVRVLAGNRATVTVDGGTVCLDLNRPEGKGRVTDGAC